MSILLIANIIGFAGSLLMVLVGLIKTKSKILWVQNLQFLLQGIANLLLGGISGVVANSVSIIRNFICLKWDLTLPLKVVFIAFQFIFTILTNNMGIPGWLPFVAATIFTFCLDTKNEVILKIAIIAGELCWIIYDLLIKNYTSCAFDCFTVVTNIVGIFMVLSARKKIEK